MPSQPVQGAGLAESAAADAISRFRRPEAAPQAAQPQAQPAQTEATPIGQPKDPATGRFVPKELEAATQEPPGETGAELPEGNEGAEPTDAAAKDSVELADTIQGLAQQFEVDPETLMDHLGLTVKVNGEEKRATLRDLQRGYQMDADYRQKTAALAEREREIAPQRERIAAERNHYAQTIENMIRQAMPILQAEDQRLQAMLDPNQPSYDPPGYMREKAQLEQRQRQLAQLDYERQQAQQRQRQDQDAEFRRDVLHHEKLLFDAIPEWSKDTAKARAEVQDIKDYVSAQGFADKDGLSREYRAPLILIARKAMLWDKSQATAKAVVKDVAKLPRILKPGAAKAQDKTPSKVKVHKQNMQRFMKNPSDNKALVSAIGSFRALKK